MISKAAAALEKSDTIQLYKEYKKRWFREMQDLLN